MNILILNYEFPPVGGGASSASYNLAKQFVKNKHSVDVLTCRISGKSKVENIEGITVYRVLSIRKGPHEAGLFGAFSYLIAAHFKLRNLIKVKKYNYAIFFFAVPTGLLSFYWHRKVNMPYIICLRGSDVPKYDQDAKLVNSIHSSIFPITHHILKNAHKVIANSISLRSLALNSFPDIPISVITNGVSHTIFKPNSNKKINTEVINALCVARLVKRKGVNLILHALECSELSNLNIWIVGSGPDEKNLLQLAEKLGIKDRVKFIGREFSEQLAERYAKADFLIHAALTESFSMTLLEAMASGLPIIASDVGGIPELIEDNINGILFPPGDIDALRTAMVAMCVNTKLRSKFSENNRMKILDKFTWEHICAQYLDSCTIDSDKRDDFVCNS